jgi:nitroreductase
MEFRDVIAKRKTIRDFQTKEVSTTIIDYAIENGFKAPTYNHLRDWDFIIIKSLESKLKLIESENLEKTIDIGELERLFMNEEPVMKEMYMDAIPKQKKMILEAPYVVIVVFKPKTKIEEAKRIYDLNCLASVWTCIENFLLSLAEYNVYGVTFIPQNIEMIKEKLGIPDGLEIASIIPIGYMADNASILKQKTIDIAKRKHYERW